MSHILQSRFGWISRPLYQVSECAAEVGRNEDAKAALKASRVPADVGFQPNQGLRQESSKRKDRAPWNDPAEK
jgi:hypothetical protein